MIQLQELHIKTRFKNIENLIINFEKSNGLTLLIGNNGSGKSNIVEAISSIFAGLYNNEFNPSFSYEIKYLKEDASIHIIYNHIKTKNKYLYSVANPTDYLPSQLICIYSGEELRLWNRYYFKFYDNYIKDVISNKRRFSEKQRMEFINKYYWNLALITMIVSDLDVSDIIREKKVDTIALEFKKNNIDNIKKYVSNEVIRFANLLYSISTPDKSNSEVRILKLSELKKHILDTHTEFFKLFSIAILPREDNWKLINKLDLIFDNGMSSEELSEGEKKQILIKFITRIFADENSILLLDEPDAHIHVQNKSIIKKLLVDSNNNYKPYVQSVLTTHSPTLTDCFDNENVYMLNNGKLEEKQKQNIIYELTKDIWSKPEQNYFLSQNKDLILVEGKTDKLHLEIALKKLQSIDSKYSNLSFKYLPFNGASGLKLFVEEFPVNPENFTIAFLDRDQAGSDAIKETLDFKGTIDEFRGEIKNNINIFYIPKKDDFTKSKFVIEDYYSFETYMDFMLQKVDCVTEIPNNTNSSFKVRFAAHVEKLDPKEFYGFRILFDLIMEIKQNYDKHKSDAIIDKEPEKQKTFFPPSINKKVSIKDTQFEYWTALRKYVLTQNVSFKMQMPAKRYFTYISIGSTNFKIRLEIYSIEKNISVKLICKGTKALYNFKNLKLRYEDDAITNLTPNLKWEIKDKKKEHHITLILSNYAPLNREDWTNQHEILTEWIEKFYNYFKDKIQNIPEFTASIYPLKIKQGDDYTTKVLFKGNIKNGFFDNRVENKKTGLINWHWDKETIYNSKKTNGGILNGSVDINKEISFSTVNMEKGKYVISVRIYEHPVIGEVKRYFIAEEVFEVEIV